MKGSGPGRKLWAEFGRVVVLLLPLTNCIYLGWRVWGAWFGAEVRRWEAIP